MDGNPEVDGKYYRDQKKLFILLYFLLRLDDV